MFSIILLMTKTLPAQVRHIRKSAIDSICAGGQKYDKPERTTVAFPAKEVSDAYKLKALHKALPDSLNNEENKLWWYYNYFFELPLTDYDPVGDSLTYPTVDAMKYKLDHTFFFDINGDGRLDFIHYTKYVRALALSRDGYELFLMNADSTYTMVPFNGYITDYKFNRNGTLHSFTGYQAACCSDVNHIFYNYVFDRKKNTLVLVSTKTVLTCQFKTPVKK